MEPDKYKNEASKIFADRLQDLLAEKKDAGKHLAAVAKELGISSGALSNYQNNNAKINIDSLKKIADYFDVSCDYLTGRIATKQPLNYSSDDELDLSDKSIACLKKLKKGGKSWVLNHLFADGFDEILNEAAIMHVRKKRCEHVFNVEYENREYYDNYGYLDDEILADDGTYFAEDKLLLENNRRILNNEEHQEEALQFLKEKGEHVNFVPAGPDSVAIGMVNVLIEVNQYLSWRFNAVGEKAKSLFISFLEDEIE